MTIDTTLLVHFFGKKGKAELTFDDFYRYDELCVKSLFILIHPLDMERYIRNNVEGMLKIVNSL